MGDMGDREMMIRFLPDLENALDEALQSFPYGTYSLIASSRDLPKSKVRVSLTFVQIHELYWQIYDLKKAANIPQFELTIGD